MSGAPQLHAAFQPSMASSIDQKSLSKETISTTEVVEIDDAEALGRKRPVIFSSAWREWAFVVCMLVSLSMADFIIGGFQVVLPAIIEPLHIPLKSKTWPASVLTMTAGSFLFPFGRLADMYGGYVVFNGGMMWFSLWTVIGGFSNNLAVLTFCRAMEGLGASAFLPAGISLLSCIYSPGPRKNLVFSLYGALAPIGFFCGIITGGSAQTFLQWRWFFWLGGIISVIFGVGTMLTAPRDYAEARRNNIKMDWLGFGTTVPGFLLLTYALTDASKAPHGWADPRVLVTLILGILFLMAAVYVEGWVAESPLIPADIFKVKYIKRMMLSLFIVWGNFALFLFYSNFYIQRILGKSPLLAAAWFAPWTIAGIVLSVGSGFILHMLSGRLLLVLSSMCKIVAVALFALMPEHPNYWAWIMPAMVAEAACVDVVWTVSNVFLTTSLPKHRQGIAGAVINITLFIGSAFFLAIADVALKQFEKSGQKVNQQYRSVFWLGVGFGAISLILFCFIKVGRAGVSNVSEVPETELEKQKKGSVSESDSDDASIRYAPPAGDFFRSEEKRPVFFQEKR